MDLLQPIIIMFAVIEAFVVVGFVENHYKKRVKREGKEIANIAGICKYNSKERKIVKIGLIIFIFLLFTYLFFMYITFLI